MRRKHKSTYRSGLEDRTAELLTKRGVKFKYEPKDGVITYNVPAKTCKYTPDFYVTTKTGKTIIIETKGIWDREDRVKHLLIKQQAPHLDIRFVFSSSRSRIRKGSKTTYRDICEGRGRGPFKGVVWRYADKTIPEDWLDE